MATKDTGIVNIHGRDYQTVAYRVKQFREEHGLDFSISTEIISIDDQAVVFKATISKDGQVIATGHAEEKRNATTINRTSALEVAETSAIGRCLASFGYLGTEFATADEVAQAIHEQTNGTYQHVKVKPEQRMNQYTKDQQKMIKARVDLYNAFTDLGISNTDEMKTYIVQVIGKDEITTPEEAKQIIEALEKEPVPQGGTK